MLWVLCWSDPRGRPFPKRRPSCQTTWKTGQLNVIQPSGRATIQRRTSESLVSATDLSQVTRAFDLNGYVGILYFLVTAASVYLNRP